MHGAIKEGEGMAEPLGKSGIFDDMVMNMIDVGEETGESSTRCHPHRRQLRPAGRREADGADLDPRRADRLMGGAVAFIVFAIFLPMLKIVESIGGGCRQ